MRLSESGMLFQMAYVVFEIYEMNDETNISSEPWGQDIDVILLDMAAFEHNRGTTILAQLRRSFSIPIIAIISEQDLSSDIWDIGDAVKDILIKGRSDGDVIQGSILSSIASHRTKTDKYRGQIAAAEHDLTPTLFIDPNDELVIDANIAACCLFRSSKEEMAGSTLTSLFPGSEEIVTNIIHTSTVDGQRHSMECNVLIAEISKTLDIHLEKMHSRNDQFIRMMVYDKTGYMRSVGGRSFAPDTIWPQDISTEVERELSSNAFAIFSGPDLRLRLCNGTYCDILYGAGVGVDPTGVRAEDDLFGQRDILNALREAQETNRPKNIRELRWNDTSGKATYWNLFIMPFLDRNDQQLMLYMTNITDIIEAKDRAVEMASTYYDEKIKLKTTIDSLPIGIWIFDNSGKEVVRNDLISDIWVGQTSRSITSKDFSSYTGWWTDTGILLQEDEWAIPKVLMNGEPVVDNNIDILRADGSRGSIIISASPLKDNNDSLIGAVAVVRDITKQRSMERDAIDAKGQAENLHRSSFP